MSEQDLKVFISGRESTCDECGEMLGRSAWICLLGERGALCLSCADRDHLVFLPAEDTALTRRAKAFHAIGGCPEMEPRAQNDTSGRACWSRRRHLGRLNPNAWPTPMPEHVVPSATPSDVQNSSRHMSSDSRCVCVNCSELPNGQRARYR